MGKDQVADRLTNLISLSRHLWWIAHQLEELQDPEAWAEGLATAPEKLGDSEARAEETDPLEVIDRLRTDVEESMALAVELSGHPVALEAHSVLVAAEEHLAEAHSCARYVAESIELGETREDGEVDDIGDIVREGYRKTSGRCLVALEKLACRLGTAFAVEERNRRLSQPRDAEELAADGPAPPNLLIWKGKPNELPPRLWRLLDFMWTRDVATLAEVEEKVWDSESVQTGTVRSATSKLTTELLGIGCPMTFSIKSGYVRRTSHVAN